MEIPKDLDSIANRQENQGARIIYRALKKQYIALAAQYENGQDLKPDKDIIKAALTSFHSRTQLEMADWQYNKLIKQTPIKALQIGLYEKVLSLIRTWITLNIGSSINSISSTTLDQVRKVIANGQEQGFGARKIGQLLREEAKSPFTVYRSTVIARTEGTRAASQGAKIGAEQWENITGQKKWKAWSASADSRTRDQHLAMIDSKPIPGDQDFIVGGQPMDGPGDPHGGADNTINCRCRKYYMSERVARQLAGLAPSPKKIIETDKPYELTADKIKKLKEKGIDIKGEAEDINKIISGFNIEEFDNDMLAILKANGITDVERSFSNFGGANVNMSYRSKNNKNFRLDRIFKSNNNIRSVEHDLFVLGTNLQGSGLSKQTFKTLYKQYKAADISVINVHANINVGGYTWAKYGFNVKNELGLIDIKSTLIDKYGENSLQAKDFDEIIEAGGDNMMNKIANTTYGKSILLGSDWYGSLNLKNNIQRKIFEDYLE